MPWTCSGSDWLSMEEQLALGLAMLCLLWWHFCGKIGKGVG